MLKFLVLQGIPHIYDIKILILPLPIKKCTKLQHNNFLLNILRNYTFSYMFRLYRAIFRLNLVEVKQSYCRSGQALRVPRVWASQILRQSANKSGKFVSPTHRPPLPQGIILVLVSVRGWVDPRAIVRPEGLCQWKIPLTLSGIDLVTFRADHATRGVLPTVARRCVWSRDLVIRGGHT
jgi:hypothetical protein